SFYHRWARDTHSFTNCLGMSLGNPASISEVLQAHVLTEIKGRQIYFFADYKRWEFPILESHDCVSCAGAELSSANHRLRFFLEENLHPLHAAVHRIAMFPLTPILKADSYLI